MESENSMTMQQAQEKMKVYEEVFDIVRLLDENSIGKIKKQDVNDNDISMLPCECYSFWNKTHPCDNCISLKAFNEKSQRTKLEFLNSDIYEVISKYVEIDGKPYVMELLKQLDDDTMLDLEGHDKLLGKLTMYTEKLYKDAITGAYNRSYYEDEIKTVNSSAGVAVIDLDDFKLYNDTYGHNAGDIVLATVAKTIRKSIRKNDVFVRYGGDEFVLVMPKIEEETFNKKLEEIKNNIRSADIPGYTRLKLSVSIGGVIAKNETVEDAVVRADKLMYQAKNEKDMVVTQNGAFDEDSMDVLHERERIKQQILIVDDSEMNREILTEMLKSEYKILEACNGEECLYMLQQYGTGISIVLLDIVMSKMDGFQVLSVMNRNHWIEDIPVVMISSEDSESYIRRAYEMGVSDYISRPFDAKIVYQRVSNTIKLYAKQRRLITLIIDQIYEKEKNNRMMIGILSQIVEFRNGESGLHVQNINILTGMLIERLVQKTDKYNITWAEGVIITTASALHDIGKIGIDEKILNKPGKLTDEEFEIMKTHTVIGASILEDLDVYRNEELVKTARDICRWHHERYDGKGYPDGLKGDEIPISAQVVSLADVYDALVSKRVYKKSFTHEQAMKMILNGECGQFNPILLECLVDIQGRIKEEMSYGLDEREQKQRNMSMQAPKMLGNNWEFSGGGI
ncbi:diguanylate cyclase [Anaerotignum sp. MSJ-24]|uniref:diguanylate cyclase n=1 Tax=Anaerotignum sp. MSJ-24 TaxID=2841521 RepID=UPI001C1269D5|nr:diguanylate cyclase [Anaerotignum sp. MSJ-24]MBU5463637.1 diguanylate cyclase [Anaerotignum sp. MSJ-24]